MGLHQKVGIVVSLIFFPLFVFSQELMIVEVQVRGDSPDESYIKIYNPEKETKNISGYRLKKKSSTGREYSVRVFPKESFILPQGYFLWANSKNDYHVSVKADVYSATGISSNNSVALFSKGGELIDSLAWGNGENQFILGNPFFLNPQSKESIKRTVLEGLYKNTKDNSSDFYLFSEKEPLQLTQREEIFNLEKENSFPFREGISTVFSLSFLSVFLKRKLTKKYGRA